MFDSYKSNMIIVVLSVITKKLCSVHMEFDLNGIGNIEVSIKQSSRTAVIDKIEKILSIKLLSSNAHKSMQSCSRKHDFCQSDYSTQTFNKDGLNLKNKIIGFASAIESRDKSTLI